MDNVYRAERMLRAALAYASKVGWAVIPLHSVQTDGCCSCGKPDCQSIGKHPRTEHGLHDATTDPELITQYWTRWPDANIGVRTGAASGIVAIDIDPDAGGEYSLEDLEAEIGQLPNTVQQQTGSGGCHLIFNHPGNEVRNSAGTLGSGVDVRGDEGYILVPPSVNQAGQYIWEDSSHPLRTPTATLPSALIEKLVCPNGHAPAPKIAGPIPKGQRNSTLTSMAGSMRNRGGEQAEIRAALLEMNKRCEPPLSDDEVGRIATSVAKYPQAEAASFDAVKTNQGAHRSLILTPASTIETKPARWTWEDRIPAGEITLTVGLGGVGKSTFHAWMITQITKGLLPGLHWGTPMACIICAQEDSWGRTIAPRLIAADANLDMVYRVDVVEAGEDMRLTLPVDIEALTSEIEAKKVALVSLDPLMSLISGGIDTHKDHEVRRALEPLAKLADSTGCAILGNGHFNKASGTDPMMRITGSAAFGQVVRAVLAFAVDSDECVMSQAKNNLGRLDLPSLAYRIEPAEVTTDQGATEVGRLSFVGEASRSVSDILGDRTDDDDRTKLEEATEWLSDILQKGPTLKKDILTYARREGIADRTLDRAAKNLGVVSERDESEQGMPSTWSLPGFTPKVSRQTPLAHNISGQSSEVGAPESGVIRQPEKLAYNPVWVPPNEVEEGRERLLL